MTRSPSPLRRTSPWRGGTPRIEGADRQWSGAEATGVGTNVAGHGTRSDESPERPAVGADVMAGDCLEDTQLNCRWCSRSCGRPRSVLGEAPPKMSALRVVGKEGLDGEVGGGDLDGGAEGGDDREQSHCAQAGGKLEAPEQGTTRPRVSGGVGIGQVALELVAQAGQLLVCRVEGRRAPEGFKNAISSLTWEDVSGSSTDSFVASSRPCRSTTWTP